MHTECPANQSIVSARASSGSNHPWSIGGLSYAISVPGSPHFVVSAVNNLLSLAFIQEAQNVGLYPHPRRFLSDRSI